MNSVRSGGSRLGLDGTIIECERFLVAYRSIRILRATGRLSDNSGIGERSCNRIAYTYHLITGRCGKEGTAIYGQRTVLVMQTIRVSGSGSSGIGSTL